MSAPTNPQILFSQAPITNVEGFASTPKIYLFKLSLDLFLQIMVDYLTLRDFAHLVKAFPDDLSPLLISIGPMFCNIRVLQTLARLHLTALFALQKRGDWLVPTSYFILNAESRVPTYMRHGQGRNLLLGLTASGPQLLNFLEKHEMNFVLFNGKLRRAALEQSQHDQMVQLHEANHWICQNAFTYYLRALHNRLEKEALEKRRDLTELQLWMMICEVKE